MEPVHLVLLLAVLAASTTAVTPNYPVPSFTGFTPYAYSNFAAPQSLPFRPLFSYAYQAEAPLARVFTPAIVPGTAISRVIYADNASPKTPMNDQYRGFSYQTRYDGGRSEVVFVTGPDSKKLMEQNIQFFRSILLPPSNAANTSKSGEAPVALSPEARTTTTDSPRTENKIPSAPLSNIQQSSVYRFQLFPAHTSPLLGSPLPLHTTINSYFQTFGHSPFPSQESTKENSDQYNAEAQESMISELGRILAPDARPAESGNSVSQSQDASVNSVESNSIDVPSSSNAPDTTQASTSESNSSITEQTSIDTSASSSNEITSTQMQENSTQTQETTSAQSQETTSAQSQETTSAQSQETTSAQSQETTSAQTQETTSAETQETTSVLAPETTSVQMPEAISTTTQETITSQQTSAGGDGATSEASPSTDIQFNTTEQPSSSDQNETTPSTNDRSDESNTESAETLAESA